MADYQGRWMNNRRKLLVVVWVALAMTTAAAAEYPTKPNRMIVPSAAGGTPEQFTEHLRRETAKWAGVIKAAGIKPQ
jgi:tripartite-type tricarboxylate transporter receptor subunit TctC